MSNLRDSINPPLSARDLLGVIGHDTRDPLQRIKGLCQLMQAGSWGKLSDQQEHILGLIVREVDTVEDIMKFAKKELERIGQLKKGE